MDILQTIQNLRDELNIHNHNYYVLDKPSISDLELIFLIWISLEIQAKISRFILTSKTFSFLLVGKV